MAERTSGGDEPPRNKADLEREIAATRIQLGYTVDELAGHLDVKTRLRARIALGVTELRATIRQRPGAVTVLGVGTLVTLMLVIRRSRS